MPNATSIRADQFDGEQGWATLLRHGRFTSADPRRYRGRLRSVRVGGVRLREWSSTPLHGWLAAARPPRRIMLANVRSGTLAWGTESSEVVAEAGTWHLVELPRTIRLDIRQTTQVLMVVVPAGMLPTDLSESVRGRACAVPTTRVTDALGALATQVLDPAAGGANCAASRAIPTLAEAVIAEAVPTESPRTLRDQITRHIEEHLGDPELSPRTIADAFEISLRWAHQQFAVEGETLARQIRTRRLSRVAAELESSREFPNLTAIAHRYGFTSRDAMSRAFIDRYGLSIREYAARAALGLPRDGSAMMSER